MSTITFRTKDLAAAAAALFKADAPKARIAAELINKAVTAEQRIRGLEKDLAGAMAEIKKLREITAGAEAHSLMRVKREKELCARIDDMNVERLNLIRDYEQKLDKSDETLKRAIALIEHLTK